MTIFDHLLDILRMPNSVAGESRGEISVRRECLGEVGGVRHMTENARIYSHIPIRVLLIFRVGDKAGFNLQWLHSLGAEDEGAGDGPVRVGVQWSVGRGAAGPGRLSG